MSNSRRNGWRTYPVAEDRHGKEPAGSKKADPRSGTEERIVATHGRAYHGPIRWTGQALQQVAKPSGTDEQWKWRFHRTKKV